MTPSLVTSNVPTLTLPTPSTGRSKIRSKRPLTLDLGAAKKLSGVCECDSSPFMPLPSPCQATNSDNRSITQLSVSVPPSPAKLSFTSRRKPFDFEKRLREDYRRCYV